MDYEIAKMPLEKHKWLHLKITNKMHQHKFFRIKKVEVKQTLDVIYETVSEYFDADDKLMKFLNKQMNRTTRIPLERWDELTDMLAYDYERYPLKQREVEYFYYWSVP